MHACACGRHASRNEAAPACWAGSVVIVLDLVVAEEADLVATLAWAEVAVGHIHVLHAKRTACGIYKGGRRVGEGPESQKHRTAEGRSATRPARLLAVGDSVGTLGVPEAQACGQAVPWRRRCGPGWAPELVELLPGHDLDAGWRTVSVVVHDVRLGRPPAPALRLCRPARPARLRRGGQRSQPARRKWWLSALVFTRKSYFTVLWLTGVNRDSTRRNSVCSASLSRCAAAPSEF